MINNKGYDGAKADLWSCGVILFVLMAGYLPFEESNLMALYKKVYVVYHDIHLGICRLLYNYNEMTKLFEGGRREGGTNENQTLRKG